jgi:hypothetical protein
LPSTTPAASWANQYVLVQRDVEIGPLGLTPRAMTGHYLEIVPLSRHRWVVRYEGDVTPLSEHATQTDARVEARHHARQFGEPMIYVHELDGGATPSTSSRTSGRPRRRTSKVQRSSPSCKSRAGC